MILIEDTVDEDDEDIADEDEDIVDEDDLTLGDDIMIDVVVVDAE